VKQLFVRDVGGNYFPAGVAEVVETAKSLLGKKLAKKSRSLSSPAAVVDWLLLRLCDRSREAFCVIYLNTKCQVLNVEELFHGTLAACSVYPREVARRALLENAASVILAHNHPGGCPEPSANDVAMTKELQKTLDLIDVKVLDHFVIGAEAAISMAERGLI